MNRQRETVCVLCGRPWTPKWKNVCECGGFCTWGPAVGADPDSWINTGNGFVPKPPPEDVQAK